MEPEIAPSLKNQIDSIEQRKGNKINSNEIAIGTNCKNGGCTLSYQGKHLCFLLNTNLLLFKSTASAKKP